MTGRAGFSSKNPEPGQRPERVLHIEIKISMVRPRLQMKSKGCCQHQQQKLVQLCTNENKYDPPEKKKKKNILAHPKICHRTQEVREF
jgi:hypothetical protein